MRSLILGGRSLGCVVAGAGDGAPAGAAPGSAGALGGTGRGGTSRRGGAGRTGGLDGAAVPGAAAAGRMPGLISLEMTFGGAEGAAGVMAGRTGALMSGAAGLILTTGSGPAGFAGGIPLSGTSIGAAAAGAGISTSGAGSGAGGSVIFRRPRMRSPLGVLATRAGSTGLGSAWPLTCRRTRSTVASSSELLWLLTWTFMPASKSVRALLLKPSSLASSCTRIRHLSPYVVTPPGGRRPAGILMILGWPAPDGAATAASTARRSSQPASSGMGASSACCRRPSRRPASAHVGVGHTYAPRPDCLPVGSILISPAGVRTIRTSSRFGRICLQATHIRVGIFLTLGIGLRSLLGPPLRLDRGLCRRRRRLGWSGAGGVDLRRGGRLGGLHGRAIRLGCRYGYLNRLE